MAKGSKAQVFELRFDQFDVNQDGRIDRSDFEQEANRLIRAFGADPDSPRAIVLRHSYMSVYEYIVSQADVKSEALSREEFVAAATSAISNRGGAGFAEVMAPYAYACANLCDIDGDGMISRQEIATWLAVIGVRADAVDEAYQAIDTDRDGKVTIDELVAAIKGYVLGQTEIRVG